MDIAGRWIHIQEHWSNTTILKQNDLKLFESSLFYKHMELNQFELFINKIKLDEQNEHILFVLKAVKQPLVEEKINLTKLALSGQEPNNSLSIIQNFERDKNHFNILRMGPKPDQCCYEYYRFDGLGRLHVLFLAVGSNGKTVTFSRSFERVEDPTHLQREKVRFFMTAKTLGWDQIVSCPNQVLELIRIKFKSLHRYKDDIRENEVLFASNLTAEQKQAVTFGEEYEHYQYSLQFEVQVGDKCWTISRSYEEVRDFSEFLRQQMQSESFQIKRLLPPKTWKNYLEMQRQMMNVDNLFLMIYQNCEGFSANGIAAFLYFAQFPSNYDMTVKTYLEQMLQVSLLDPQQSGYHYMALVESIVANTLESSYQEIENVDPSRQSPTHQYPPEEGTPTVTAASQRGAGNNPLFQSRRLPQQRLFSLTVKQELQRSSSGEIVGYKDVYHIPPSVKYMPVDMVNTPSVKKSIARTLLYSALKNGITVIKHGRQGKPKKRILTCDDAVTVLFWLPEQGSVDQPIPDAKSINLSDVLQLREGIDIDPETSSAALTAAAANGVISSEKLMEIVKAKEDLKNTDRKPNNNLFESIFGRSEKDGILLGTATLRRNCKPEDFQLSFSLILPDRTLDIQCLSRKDYDTLVINLRELTEPSDPISSGELLHSTWSFNAPSSMENPLKRKPSLKQLGSASLSPKKSVRFVDIRELGSANKERTDSNTTSSYPTAGILKLQPPPALDSTPSRTGYSTTTSLTMSDYSGDQSQATSKKTKDSDTVYEVGVDGNLDLLLKKGDTSPLHHNVFSQDSYDADDKVPGVVMNSSRRTSTSHLRLSSTEAIQLGMLLAEQEKKYGVNMYETLKPEDECLIEDYVKKGYTTEEAILMIFEDRYGGDSERRPVTPRKKASLMNMEGADAKDVMMGRKSPLFPTLLDRSRRKTSAKQLDEKSSQYIPREEATPSPKDNSNLSLKISAAETLQIGLLLSQQEREYGTNMYESLTPADEIELISMVNNGMPSHEAALKIFERKFSYHVRPETDTTDDHNTNTNTDSSSNHTSKDGNVNGFGRTNGMSSPASEKLRIVIHPAEVLNRSGSSLFPASNAVLPASPREHDPTDDSQTPPKGQKRLSSSEAIQLAMTLSEQESTYGVNMYDSLTPQDEPDIQAMMTQGMSMEDAVLAIFERKFVHNQPAVSTRQNSTNVYGSSSQGPPMQHTISQLSMGSTYYSPNPPNFAPPPLVHSGRSVATTNTHTLPTTSSMYSMHSANSQRSYESERRSMAEASYASSPYYPPPPHHPHHPMDGMPSPYMHPYPPSPMMPMPGHPSPYGYMMPSPSYPMYSPYPGMPMHPGPFSPAYPPHSAIPVNAQPVSSRPRTDRTASTRSAVSTNDSPARSDSARYDSPPSSSKKLRIASMFMGKSSKEDKQKNHKCKESDIRKITDMGFTRDQAITALVQNDHNLVMAINSLTA